MRGVFIDGEKTRRLRQLAGLTQEELARTAQCDVKTVRRAEKGGRLDINTVRKIAQALGAEYGDIVLFE